MKKRRVFLNVAMAFFVAGLFLTASCAKKTVVSEPTGAEVEEGKTAEQKEAQAEQEKLEKEKALEEQRLEEQRLKEYRQAKERFENRDIHFDFDESVLTPAAQKILKEKAAWLKENRNITVMIEGHCDERGTTEYNLALGERRAKSAKTFLMNLGISADRLTCISYGEEKPLDPRHNEEAWAKNRRAHFVAIE